MKTLATKYVYQMKSNIWYHIGYLGTHCNLIHFGILRITNKQNTIATSSQKQLLISVLV